MQIKDHSEKPGSNMSELLPLLSKSMIRKKEELSHSLNSALVSTVSKIGEFKTNLLYSIKHSDITPMSRKEIEIKKGGPQAQLLGHHYNYQQAYKFLFVFRNTYWFTYRKGIKDIESDNGWGCMIRTVQMIFAEVLKRHLSLKDKEEDHYEIIRYFCEQSDGVLSLSAVCEEGQIVKRWTSSLEIFATFKNIMKKNPSHFTFSFEIYSSGVTFKKQKQLLLPQYPALISLSNRVSLDSIPQEYYGHYFDLMDHPSWVGSIGGLHGQALYIIGSYEDKVIFLDPHYVQSNQQELQVDTYFCKTPRGIAISALSPSLSFCYYFANEFQHLNWIRWISKTCQKRYPDLVFEFMQEGAKLKLEQMIQKQKYYQLKRQNSYDKEERNPQGLQQIELEIVSDERQNSGEFEILE